MNEEEEESSFLSIMTVAAMRGLKRVLLSLVASAAIEEKEEEEITALLDLKATFMSFLCCRLLVLGYGNKLCVPVKVFQIYSPSTIQLIKDRLGEWG